MSDVNYKEFDELRDALDKPYEYGGYDEMGYRKSPDTKLNDICIAYDLKDVLLKHDRLRAELEAAREELEEHIAEESYGLAIAIQAQKELTIADARIAELEEGHTVMCAEIDAANERVERVRHHCIGEPCGRSDEDIPDEDKCAAHEMGYVDAQTNILAILTESAGGKE